VHIALIQTHSNSHIVYRLTDTHTDSNNTWNTHRDTNTHMHTHKHAYWHTQRIDIQCTQTHSHAHTHTHTPTRAGRYTGIKSKVF